MPLDGRTYKPKIKSLETGLAGLRQISNALRVIPPEWHWDFAEVGCGSHGCAIGLTWAIWPEQKRTSISYFLGLPEKDMSPIFGLSISKQSESYNKPASEVTPYDVADAIDQYVATAEKPANGQS